MTFNQWVQIHNISPQALSDLMRVTLPDNHPNDSTSETATQNQIRIAASQMNFSMWRNNNGAAEMIEKDGSTRFVRFGVGNDSSKLNKVWKSPDLVGIGPRGRFVGCEVKHPDWKAPSNERDLAQLNCLNQINALGGIGFFATSEQEYKKRMLENG